MSAVLRRAVREDLKALDVSRDLHRYLVETASGPFSYDDDGIDCCEFAADWVLERTGFDPMWFVRGGYKTEAEARKIVSDAGGLINLWRLGLSDLMLPEPDSPRIGDVGIVRVNGEHGPEEVGAIYGGKRWAMLSRDGLFCVKEKAVAQWRL